MKTKKKRAVFFPQNGASKPQKLSLTLYVYHLLFGEKKYCFKKTFFSLSLHEDIHYQVYAKLVYKRSSLKLEQKKKCICLIHLR